MWAGPGSGTRIMATGTTTAACFGHGQLLGCPRSSHEAKWLPAGHSGVPSGWGIDHGKSGDQTSADQVRVDAALNRMELVYCELDPGDAIFSMATCCIDPIKTQVRWPAGH